MRKLMEMYNIDAKKWDLIRSTVVELEGKKFIDPQAIQKIPDRAILEYIGEPMDLNNTATINRIDNIRDEIELDMMTFINDRVDFAVITPTARESVFMNFGTTPGTVEGEALRFLMQFKSFPLTVWNKLLRGDWKREGIGGFQHSMAMMLGMTAMGYAAMSIKDVARGKTPRPVDNAKTWAAAFLQGGALGIFGDLMFGPETRYGHSAFEDMLGPTASVFGDISNIYSSWRSGKDASSQVANFVRNNAPFANVWWARTILDYGLWYSFQEMNNPGYSRRMKRKIEDEQGQTFWLSPTTQRLRPFK